MADMATSALNHILNSDDYEVIPNVPIFDAHDEFEKGRLVRRFGESELQEICDNMQKKQRDTGTLIPLGAGHTIKFYRDADGNERKADQSMQPTILGYAANLRVGNYGKDKNPAIIADKYIAKKVLEADKTTGDLREQKIGRKYVAEQFPQRSIELYPLSKTIGWISLQKHAPARDLGLTHVAYSVDGFSVKPVPFSPTIYRDPRHEKPLVAAFREGCLFYSMEDCGMPQDMSGTAVADPLDPTQQPNADGPDEAFMNKVMQCIKAMFPNLEKLHAATTPDPEPTAPGTPGGTNTMIPGEEKEEDKAMNAPLQMSKAEEVLKYELLAREHEDLKGKVAELLEKNKVVAYEKEEAVCRYQLDGLRQKGFQFDYDDELRSMVPANEEGRQKILTKIVKYSKQSGYGIAPGGDMIPTRVPKQITPADEAAVYNQAREDVRNGKATSIEKQMEVLLGRN